MKLHAKLLKGTTVIIEKEGVLSGQEKLHRQLEQTLVELCREMGISVPMWLGKNTREFVRFRWTTFHADQFLEPVRFDALEIRLMDEG